MNFAHLAARLLPFTLTFAPLHNQAKHTRSQLNRLGTPTDYLEHCDPLFHNLPTVQTSTLSGMKEPAHTWSLAPHTYPERFDPMIALEPSYRSGLDFCAQQLDSDAFEFSGPPTQPSTACEVVMCEHKFDASQHRVFKVFFDVAAHTRFVYANQALMNLDAGLVKPVIEQGQVKLNGQVWPYVIMDAAVGADLETLQQHNGPEVILATSKAADKLKQLHHLTRAPLTGPFAQSRQKAVAQNQAYQVQYLTRLIKPQGVLDVLADQGWLDQTSLQTLKAYIDEHIELYQAQASMRQHYCQLHGDFHGGNFVYSSAKEDGWMIDTETHAWSIAHGQGIAEPEEDVGRFLGALKISQLRFNKPEQWTRFLTYVFNRAYRQTLDPQVVDFFILRYFAVILETNAQCLLNTSAERCLKVDQTVASALVTWLCEVSDGGKPLMSEAIMTA